MAIYKDSLINRTNALILNDSYEVFMINNNVNGKNMWGFPEGKRENKENLEVCIKKGVLEKLGMTIKLNGILGDYKIKTPEGGGLSRIYFANIKKGDPKIIYPEKISEFRYLRGGEIEFLLSRDSLVPNLDLAFKDLTEFIQD